MSLWIQIPSKPGFSYVQLDVYITFILRDKLTKKHKDMKSSSLSKKNSFFSMNVSQVVEKKLLVAFFFLNLKVKKLNLFIRLFIYEERHIGGKTTSYICLHVNCISTSSSFFPSFPSIPWLHISVLCSWCAAGFCHRGHVFKEGTGSVEPSTQKCHARVASNCTHFPLRLQEGTMQMEMLQTRWKPCLRLFPKSLFYRLFG